MIKNNPHLLNEIKSMFLWCRDSMIKSFFEGIIGKLWCDNYVKPNTAAIFVGDFAYLSGQPCAHKELIEILQRKDNHLVIIPQSDDWYQTLLNAGLDLKKTLRYHTAIPKNGFFIRKFATH